MCSLTGARVPESRSRGCRGEEGSGSERGRREEEGVDVRSSFAQATRDYRAKSAPESDASRFGDKY